VPQQQHVPQAANSPPRRQAATSSWAASVVESRARVCPFVIKLGDLGLCLLPQQWVKQHRSALDSWVALRLIEILEVLSAEATGFRPVRLGLCLYTRRRLLLRRVKRTARPSLSWFRLPHLCCLAEALYRVSPVSNGRKHWRRGRRLIGLFFYYFSVC